MSVRPTEEHGPKDPKEQGHGHGMSRNRTPKGENLPHDSPREDKQPYAREVEEYNGDGATRAPREKTGNG